MVRTSIFALAIPYVLLLRMNDLTRGLNLRAISRLMTELGQTNSYGNSTQGDPSPTNSEGGGHVYICFSMVHELFFVPEYSSLAHSRLVSSPNFGT